MRIFNLAAIAALIIGAPWAHAQQNISILDLSMEPKKFQARPASAKEAEELDLEDGKESALEDPKPCVPPLPSGSTVGILGKSSAECTLRLSAHAQYPTALSVHSQLWCADPGGAKSRAREAVNARLAARQAALGNKPNAESAKSSEAEPSLLVKLFASTSAAKTRPAPKPDAGPHPFYDASRDTALAWDAREAKACQSSASISPELGPSISAFGSGRVATSSGACDAVAVEARFLSGRYALSRISWLASGCPGFKPVDPLEIAKAISEGDASANAWQRAHFAQAGWQGPEPRPAKGRSADSR